MDKLACVFPGQGTQFIGMGKSFYENYEIARQTYDEASEAVSLDIADLCFNGPVTAQNSITTMQLAIVVTNIAIWRVFQQTYQLQPQFFAGHSMGEFSAWNASGAVSLADTVKILKYRGEILQRALSQELGYMTIAEDISQDDLLNIIVPHGLDHAVISCYNAPQQYSVCGDARTLGIVEDDIRKCKGRATPLFNSPPIHSPILTKLSEEFEQYLSTVTFYPMRVPVITNASGMPFSDTAGITEVMKQQLVLPVLWQKILTQMDYYGVTLAVELSPKNLLSTLSDANQVRFQTFCFGVREDRQEIGRRIENSNSLERDKIHFAEQCLSIAVSTPNTCQDELMYQEGVVEVYKQMQQYLPAARNLSVEEKRSLYKLLQKLLETKGLPPEKSDQYLRQLTETTSMYYLFNH